MASFQKFNAFVEHMAEGVHNLQSNALTVFATAAANAPVAGNSVLADLTQIAYTNLSSRALTVSSSSQTSGTYKLVIADWVGTSSGGSTGPVRYWGVYNDTPTSPADPLICFLDYASEITIGNGETFTMDFDGTNGLLQVA